MNQRKTLTLIFSTLMVAVLANPAAAAVEEGTNSFEIYAGVYFPDGPVFDEAGTYGIRFGRVFTPRWGGELSAGWYGDDVTAGAIETDLDIVNVDFDFLFFANPDSRGVFHVLLGAGWANSEVTVTDKGLGASASTDSDSLTVTGGIGVRFALGAEERMYFRLDAKGRWFEDRDDDEIDFEATAAFGWVWGGGGY